MAARIIREVFTADRLKVLEFGTPLENMEEASKTMTPDTELNASFMNPLEELWAEVTTPGHLVKYFQGRQMNGVMLQDLILYCKRKGSGCGVQLANVYHM